MAFPNLSAEMARYGVSVESLAETAGVSTKTVYNWLNGTSDICFGKCKAIRNGLFPWASTDYLFDDVPKAG